MLSGYTRAISMAVVCISLVDGHPGTKRLETFKSWSFRCNHESYGLCLDQLSCENSARRTEGGSDLLDGACPGWSERLLLKSLVLVFTWPFEQNEHHGKRGWLSLVGKVHNLCRVLKTTYLAMSPVTDNFERHEFEAVQGSPHPNFFKLKLEWLTRDCCVIIIIYTWWIPMCA
jgi:hypothetical protein